ncbi:MAG: hypothetical protein JW955_09325 [Sedimentisphaerales bacterium]|nr:hypothetical protein [Sedimentisphaerales bacterium]
MTRRNRTRGKPKNQTGRKVAKKGTGVKPKLASRPATGAAKTRAAPQLSREPQTASQPAKKEPPRPATAEDMAKRQREISVAEFFTKNRHLLGFDNPRKALLTTIKEGVDNSLDACEEADGLFNAINETKIMNPPTDCLSPVGEDLILAGLKKQIEADFYTAVTRPPSVYRGNPFQIEAGVAYGGSLPADDLARLLRYANRVPLLYQQAACAKCSSSLTIRKRCPSANSPTSSKGAAREQACQGDCVASDGIGHSQIEW